MVEDDDMNNIKDEDLFRMADIYYITEIFYFKR